MTKYQCISDNEWGNQSNLVGKTQTLEEWKEWAMNDRQSVGDSENYEWFKTTPLNEIIEKIMWFYNIQIKEA